MAKHETGSARRSRFFVRIAIGRPIGDAANEPET
jgi:hypothetical protein